LVDGAAKSSLWQKQRIAVKAWLLRASVHRMRCCCCFDQGLHYKARLPLFSARLLDFYFMRMWCFCQQAQDKGANLKPSPRCFFVNGRQVHANVRVGSSVYLPLPPFHLALLLIGLTYLPILSLTFSSPLHFPSIPRKTKDCRAIIRLGNCCRRSIVFLFLLLSSSFLSPPTHLIHSFHSCHDSATSSSRQPASYVATSNNSIPQLLLATLICLETSTTTLSSSIDHLLS
jgi:hypothetical protein